MPFGGSSHTWSCLESGWLSTRGPCHSHAAERQEAARETEMHTGCEESAHKPLELLLGQDPNMHPHHRELSPASREMHITSVNYETGCQSLGAYWAPGIAPVPQTWDLTKWFPSSRYLLQGLGADSESLNTNPALPIPAEWPWAAYKTTSLVK